MEIFFSLRILKYIFITFIAINSVDFVYSSNSCRKSITTVNNTKIKCKNELIFEENFERIDNDEYFVSRDSYHYLNTSLWKKEIKIPLDPDYEFCIYHTLGKVLKVENGVLKIIPTLFENSYGINTTFHGELRLTECTGIYAGECSRKAMGFSILHPVISTRLMTKDSFSFCYGKIEIRAKFPEGDWLYPEMWLQPKYTTHDSGYLSGRVILGMARGNDHLKNSTNSSQEFGAKRLEFGLRTGPYNNITEEIVTKINDHNSWTRDYHIYTTTWTDKGFKFEVDGEVVGRLRQQLKNSDNENWMSPYDLEFYLKLGVGVGGVRVFPDKTKSGYYQKPWKNVGAKAMYHFWEAKDQWLPNWQRNGQKTAFEIDYIKIWSV
ncbi:beta-1,3-glucan-binding protein-like [Chelonus insularis]|uniref:beta-1,3-glucan-binding protein-like n=1 Tax=Chelonus insularis TaxID=460826 RepID=UPI001589162F|nr:beta-1,3-glucan-binding protein-like [Chelonus insularis]